MPKKKQVTAKDEKLNIQPTQFETEESSTTQAERSFVMLALSLITSPKDACEEILQRNLLVPGLCILVVFGLVNAVITCLSFYHYKMNSLFELATNNPVVVVGMLVLTAWLIDKSAQLLQAESHYIDTLTIISWASLVGLIGTVIGLTPKLELISLIGSIWAIVIWVIGIQHIYKFTIWKSIASCILAGIILQGVILVTLPRYLLEMTYPKSAITIPSLAAYMVPIYLVTAWLAAAALIILAAVTYRSSDEKFTRFQTLMTTFAVVGAITAVVATAYIQTINPINDVLKGAAAYNNPDDPDPARAIKRFTRELSYFPSDFHVRVYLAQSLAADSDRVEAEKAYNKILKDIGKQSRNELIKLACTTGIGTIRYIEGNFIEARKRFVEAATVPKDYPAAATRLALTELRLGKQKEAIKAATDAIDAGDDSILPQIVLAQAYTVTKDMKNAEKAIAAVRKINKATAERLSSGPDGWSKAVEWLTPVDIRLPLTLPHYVSTPKR
jgi:tetratricopeptide (TPR) repeat protein